MAIVSQLSETEYKINITDGDLVRAFPENFTEIESEFKNDSSMKTVSGTVEVFFDKDAADTIRKMVSSELTLGLNMGDRLAENKYLEALFCSPLPFTGLYGDGGSVPTLTPEDQSAIKNGLDSLSVSTSVSLGNIKIGIGDRYILKFIPDARGFDIILENTDQFTNFTEDHAFALTVPFVISNLDVTNPIVEDGLANSSTLGTVDDTKVLFYEKDFSISGGELLTRTIALSGFHSDRGSLRDAYNSLFSLSMWRGSGGVMVEELDVRPYTSHLCGVDPSGTAIQYLPLDGMKGYEQPGSANFLISGNATVKFLVGDVRYPVKPFFGVAKAIFDICMDDQGWTDVGPLASQYVGGDGVTGEDVIHSWTGRRSTSIKREYLATIGQSNLGGDQ